MEVEAAYFVSPEMSPDLLWVIVLSEFGFVLLKVKSELDGLRFIEFGYFE